MEVKVGVKGRQTVLKILGMHCATCSLTIQKALMSVKGVKWVEASLASNEARLVVDPSVDYGELGRAVRRVGYDVYREAAYLYIDVRPEEADAVVKAVGRWGVFNSVYNPAVGALYVEYNPLEVSVEELVERLKRAGFEVRRIERGEAGVDLDRGVIEAEGRDLARRLKVAIPLTLLLVASMFIHIPPLAQLAAAAVVQFYVGWRFLNGAYRAFRNATANMDTLVTLGTLGTFLYSTAAAFLGGYLFFEVSAVVITFVLTGRYIENKMRFKTGEAVRRLAQMQPPKARIWRGGRWVETEAAKPGDLVEVREGEKIPVDGYVEDGWGHVDESAFTGEYMPVEKKRGELVLAGAVLTRGRLVVRTTRSGRYTYLAEMVRLVRQAQNARLPIQRIADKAAGVFTWLVIGIAASTFVGWTLAGAPLYMALMFTAAVLVVACPCALGLATPLAVVVGVGRAAERGILIRRPEALEKATRARYVVFDKTGTLTLGRPKVVRYIGRREALYLAACAESKSNHPLARAVVEYVGEAHLKEPEVYDALPGMGIYARIDGVVVGVGNERLVEGMGAVLPEEFRKEADRLREEGLVASYVVVGNEVRGLFALGDEIRPDAAAVVEALRKGGMELVVLSGDNERTVKAVAARLGIARYYAGADPEKKAEVVTKLKDGGVVVFVGDGVNDAPALAAADVGIAVATGTEVAKEAGDVVLRQSDLKKVAEVLQLASKVVNTAKFNLFWAFIYNAILIPLAAGVFYPLYLRPEFAGAAMALSSISVTLNALRLKL
ncbi:MAG: heavy metal translocating P-type ATPase [Pyrobaculum sp.]